jgi:hypothetical protein
MYQKQRRQKTTAAKCPWCGELQDPSAWGIDHDPKAGDLTMCTCCGRACVYTSLMGLRQLDRDDVANLAPEQLEQLANAAQRWRVGRGRELH